MAFKFEQAATLMSFLLIASMFVVSTGNKGWPQFGYNYTDWFSHNQPDRNEGSSKIIVGGTEHWHFGFNYSEWAFKNNPFYLNDTLVFKYDAPNATTFPHSVYLFQDFWSFWNCDLRRAKMVGNINQGGGEGFQFVLKKWKPHYFACGERNGFHCKVGQMKFSVMPMLRRWYP